MHSVIDQPVQCDVYRDESLIAAQLNAWRQWKRGDGVRGQVRTIVLTEDQARVREQVGDRFRLPMAVADAEQTDRAIGIMRDQDAKGWAALECYHLVAGNARHIARHAKIHHAQVTTVLRRAHDNFGHYRAMAV